MWDRAPEIAIVPLNLGPSVVLKGHVSGQEDLVIAGRVEGTIELPDHALTIAANAHVAAKIRTKTAIVMGSVAGDIIATERVEVREHGSVEGTIIAPRVVLLDGAYFRGKVRMGSAEDEGPIAGLGFEDLRI